MLYSALCLPLDAASTMGLNSSVAYLLMSHLSALPFVVVCASDCCVQLRRFRTMRELLMDAKQWAKHPWNAFGKKAASVSQY